MLVPLYVFPVNDYRYYTTICRSPQSSGDDITCMHPYVSGIQGHTEWTLNN